MIRKLHTLLFCCMLLSITSFAQEKVDSSFVVSGKVINKTTKEAIAFAHIKIDDTYLGTICDSLGFFRVRMQPKQKLRISALGYKTEMISVCPSKEGDVFQEFEMTQESYMLGEVNVYSLGSWNDFKYNFVKKKLPPDAKNIVNNNVLAGIGKAAYRYKQSDRREGLGISFGFGGGGRRKAKKIAEIKAAVNLENKLAKMFNKDMVAYITNESGKRLDLLLSYINRNTKFTFQTNERYIIEEVKRLHKKFLNADIDSSYFTFTDTLPMINHLRPN